MKMLIFLLLTCVSLISIVVDVDGTSDSDDIFTDLDAIPKLAKSRPLTISGYSSGGTMASQMQVAFSKSFDGAGAFSSVWYRCAPFGETYYRQNCSRNLYAVKKGIADAKLYQRTGKIDPLKNLKKQKFYHFIGIKDELASHTVREKTRTFYKAVGMRRNNILNVYNRHAYHTMPSDNKLDPPCTIPFLMRPNITAFGPAFCRYSGAFEALKFLITRKLVKPKGKVTLQPLRQFHQSPFLAKEDQKYMDPIGYFYVPSKCKRGRECPLHIFLHGCKSSRSNLGSWMVEKSWYLEIAEVNGIIMLFPQSIPFEGNKDGCWDIFGATNDDYATRDGVQMKALAKMVTAFTGRCLD